MKSFMGTLLKGLVTALPLALTAYAVYWILRLAETSMSALLKPLLPEDMAIPPGLGVLAGILLLFLLGTLMNLYLVRRLVGLGERILNRIPLIKTIYGAVQDMLGFFATSPEESEASQAVVIEVAGMRMLGLLTRQHCGDIPDALAKEGDVAVYLPMSYQIGGFTVFVPRESVTPLDLSIEDAMRLVLTAGMGVQKKPGDGALADALSSKPTEAAEGEGAGSDQ